MQAITRILLNSHPASRLLAGGSLLAAAIFNSSLWIAVGLFGFSALLINWLDGGCQNLIRMVRLLRWFVAPIFLLHALLSPGQLVLPESFLPLTWEGMSQGLWLSLRFATIFVAAMLLFRLLHRCEWLRGLLAIPFLGRHFIVYLLIIPTMKQSIGEQLSMMKQQWQLRSDWQMSALFLLTAFRMALATGKEQAWMLWLRWPARQGSVETAIEGSRRGEEASTLAYSAVWVLVGVAALSLVRL